MYVEFCLYENKPWHMQRLLRIDKYLNRLTGGSWESTISARIGYYKRFSTGLSWYYWFLLSRIVDFAFYPLDGKDHCNLAFNIDHSGIYKKGHWFNRFGLGCIVVCSSFPIFIINSLGIFFYTNFQATFSLSRKQVLRNIHIKTKGH